MRSLAVYLKNYKKESILAPFFKFLEVVFDLIV
ncbi:MAG: ABC transporter ATP-binding protein, partial [Blautia wexlerae]